jgi:serine/threonine-protein phosphatase 2A regulatory subunit B
MFAIGTNFGNIKLCDLRSNTDYLKYSSNFIDEFSNIIKSGFNLSKTPFSYQVMGVHDIEFINDNLFATRHFLSVNLWDRRMNTSPINKFLVYEPVINKLSHLYKNNYLANDKFELSISPDGKYILTGGYNNMFHVFDINQRLNTQCVIDDTSEKTLNLNIIRKINTKGSCFYKKEDPSYSQIDFDMKILHHCYSQKDNWIALADNNCIYTYNGNIIVKENKK